MPAAPDAAPVGLLQREIAEPLPLSRAGDWALAAGVLVVLERRAVLAWGLLFGVPYGAIALLTGAERVRRVEGSWGQVFLWPFLLYLAFEPWAGGAAYRYFKARLDGQVLGVSEVLRQAAACWAPLVVVLSAVEVPVQAVGFVLGRLLPESWLPAVVVSGLGCLAHALTLTAGPRVALDGMPPRRALATASVLARRQVATSLAAYVTVAAVSLALWALVTSPHAMAESPACGTELGGGAFCWIGWRMGYLWLQTLVTAPFYTLALVAYLDGKAASRLESVPDGRTGRP